MNNSSEEFEYDSWAEKQINDKKRSSTLVWKAQQMASLVPSGHVFESALEIGCAEGIVINKLHELLSIKKCYGVDISPIFLTIGKEKYPYIEFIQISGMKLPFANKSIDLIILSDIIEHIKNIDSFMAEVRRVGKRVLMKIPLDKYLWRKIISEPLGRSPRVGFEHPDGHLHEFSKRSVNKMLKVADFKISNSKVVYMDEEEEYRRKEGLLKIRWFLDAQLKKNFPNIAHVFFGGDYVAFMK